MRIIKLSSLSYATIIFDTQLDVNLFGKLFEKILDFFEKIFLEKDSAGGYWRAAPQDRKRSLMRPRRRRAAVRNQFVFSSASFSGAFSGSG